MHLARCLLPVSSQEKAPRAGPRNAGKPVTLYTPKTHLPSSESHKLAGASAETDSSSESSCTWVELRHSLITFQDVFSYPHLMDTGPYGIEFKLCRGVREHGDETEVLL